VFFANSCVNCHTIRGTSAQGAFGPDLTHLMSRDTLASELRRTRRKRCERGCAIRKSSGGCLMPNMQMSDTEVDQIVSYLQTLK